MPLLKAFKTPTASISINIGKDSFILGETITGDVLVTSGEDFEANEIRVELVGVEKLRVGGEAIKGDGFETPETRLYSSRTAYIQRGGTIEYQMYNGQTKVSEKLRMSKGYSL